MSSYNARRAPNVSQYLANLNHIPTPSEIQADNDLLTTDGLDFLTNADFFDFDQSTFDSNFDPQPGTQSPVDGKNVAQYGFNDFQSFPSADMTPPSTAISSPPGPLQGAYPPQPHHFTASPAVGEKRKASVAMPTAADLDEQSRVAAEEDKRRRNTAASARFRVKKKQREQALEKQAKDMSDKVSALEGKVQKLEMENKWLKELIIEKSDASTLDAALAVKQERESAERSHEARTDGVGTEEGREEVTA